MLWLRSVNKGFPTLSPFGCILVGDRIDSDAMFTAASIPGQKPSRPSLAVRVIEKKALDLRTRFNVSFMVMDLACRILVLPRRYSVSR